MSSVFSDIFLVFLLFDLVFDFGDKGWFSATMMSVSA